MIFSNVAVFDSLRWESCAEKLCEARIFQCSDETHQ